MFRFNIPLAIVLSSGSLILLAIGSLLLVGNTAYTSDIQLSAEARSINNEQPVDEQSIGLPKAIESSSVNIKKVSEYEENSNNNKAKNIDHFDSRKRSARLYGGQSGSSYGNQQPALDSYAAAFAAANSPSSQDQTSGLVQSSVQTNDASSFASFGEPPPTNLANSGPPSTSSQGSAARQLATNGEFAPHSAYYANYMSPSYSSSSFNSQQSPDYANNNNNNYNYHSPQQPTQQHYLPTQSTSQHYHKTGSSAITPLGYPSNSYDIHHSPPLASSSYYERHNPYYGNAASTPLWASGPSTSSNSGGLMSSASNALSHWTGGFGISEIICTIVAIAIGALILGAPFFLIYLALMGNFSGSGTLSLTNPTGAPAGGASTTVNGRRKRLAIFEQLSSSLNSHQSSRPMSEISALADFIVNQLNPFVDLQQVTSTFKSLMNSIEKYSNMRPEEQDKKNNKKRSSA